jgi:hypothetical protein
MKKTKKTAPKLMISELPSLYQSIVAITNFSRLLGITKFGDDGRMTGHFFFFFLSDCFVFLFVAKLQRTWLRELLLFTDDELSAKKERLLLLLKQSLKELQQNVRKERKKERKSLSNNPCFDY